MNLHGSNLQSSLLRCGTRPNEWGTQWDLNSLLLVKLANCYTIWGALNLHGKSKPAKLTSFYRRAPNAAGGLYLGCQDDMPNTFAWVMSIPPYIHPANAMCIFWLLVCQTTLKSTNILQVWSSSCCSPL